MLFISHFYSVSIKTSILVETNHLVETLQMFGKIVWLSDFLKSSSRRDDLVLLQKKNKMQISIQTDNHKKWVRSLEILNSTS